MFTKVAIILLAVYLTFEIFEHLIIPLAGRIFQKKKGLLTGAEGMIGKSGRVLDWKDDEGRVEIQSEIWNAVSDAPLSPGDHVLVEEIAGLTLRVSRRTKDSFAP